MLDGWISHCPLALQQPMRRGGVANGDGVVVPCLDKMTEFLAIPEEEIISGFLQHQ